MLNPPESLSGTEIDLWDNLCAKLVILNERVWEGRANGPVVENWLANFKGRTGAPAHIEKLHALYLATQFMYYGSKEIRVLLRAMYNELFLLPLAQQIKSSTNSLQEFKAKLREELEATRFLGVGNPSESGVHLLYYFRQENNLSKNSFLDSAQIYSTAEGPHGRTRSPLHPNVKRYIFLDDLCGSGETAIFYSKNLLPDLIANQPDVELHYLSLFAMSSGLERIRAETVFQNNCGAVYELDGTYKWGDSKTRYAADLDPNLAPSLLVALAYQYGCLLLPGHELGYGDSQLLLGFSHNTPDNTIPIIWCELENGSTEPWYPIFRRFPKM